MVVVYFATLAFISALAIFALALVFRSKPKPFVRNLLLTLIVIEIVLTALQVVSWQSHTAPFLRWFLNMNVEWSLGTVFSSVQLLLVSLVALLNATRPARWWERLYWLLFSFAFGFMALDEFYILREYMLGNVKSDFWLIPYGVLGLTLGLYSLLMFWRVYRAYFWRFVVLAIGMGLLVGGAVVLEALANRAYTIGTLTALRLGTFEEISEMMGCTLCLAAMLLFAQTNLSFKRWRVMRGVVVTGGVGWTMWLLLALYVVPTWEATTVKPAHIDYGDGVLSLMGYEIHDTSFAPGAQIPVVLYWEANEPLALDYNLSVHLLAQPEPRSVSQSDDLNIGLYPSTMWLPGTVMKRVVWLTIPADVPTPASYSIMVRVWSGDWPQDHDWHETQGLTINASDHPTLADDALILADVTVLSPDDVPPAAPQSSHYDFASGFRLYGYSLPQTVEAGGMLPVGFWWETQRDVDANLTQYVHVLDENGTMVAGEGSDQEPFGGHFPTDELPANLSMNDTWQVPLPAELPPGMYSIYTGFYDPATIVRDGVMDDRGNSIPNNEALVGMVTVE